MAVSALDSSLTYQAESQYKVVGDSTLDSTDFMSLLIAQLQYQDPTEPMDTSEMASQLAQYGTMEATQGMADNMEKLLEYQTSQNNLQLLSLLGTEVKANVNTMTLSDGNLSTGEFTLDSDASSCSVEIYNSSGNIVKTIDVGDLTADTTYQVDWDGTNSAGNQVEDGIYIFQVNAQNADGGEAGVTYTGSGTVTGLDYSTGEAMLTLNNAISVDVGSVLGVKANG